MIRKPNEVWSTAWKEISKRTGTPEIQIPFLPSLSDRLYGLRRKQLLTVGARTSMGKSCFALQLAYHCAKQGFKTYFFSLEMSDEELLERLFCQVAMIPNHDLYTSPQKYEKQAEEFQSFLKDIPLLVTYKIGDTTTDLNNVLQDLPNPDVVIVDYIQAIKHLSSDRLSIVNDYILQFRELCVKKGFAGVLVSQINRVAMEDKDRKPQLWLLKSSGVLEEHSDAVVLLHYPFFYSGDIGKINDYEVIIAKNRNGMIGTIKAQFEPQYYLITES